MEGVDSAEIQRSLASPLIEGYLGKKNAQHGFFENAYKARVYCWISAHGDFYMSRVVRNKTEKSGSGPHNVSELVAAEKLSLSACQMSRKHSGSRKFTVSGLKKDDGSKVELKFRADDQFTCQNWLLHLRQARDMSLHASDADSGPTNMLLEGKQGNVLAREASEVCCCICLDPFTDQVTARCSHTFCAECIVSVCRSNAPTHMVSFV